jgi:hypothetical protein
MSEDNICCASITIEIKQIVTLKRYPKISFPSTTWSDSKMASGGENNLVNYVRGCVKDLADKFINDYLAVNPIKPSTTQKKK